MRTPDPDTVRAQRLSRLRPLEQKLSASEMATLEEKGLLTMFRRGASRQAQRGGAGKAKSLVALTRQRLKTLKQLRYHRVPGAEGQALYKNLVAAIKKNDDAAVKRLIMADTERSIVRLKKAGASISSDKWRNDGLARAKSILDGDQYGRHPDYRKFL